MLANTAIIVNSGAAFLISQRFMGSPGEETRIAAGDAVVVLGSTGWRSTAGAEALPSTSSWSWPNTRKPGQLTGLRLRGGPAAYEDHRWSERSGSSIRGTIERPSEILTEQCRSWLTALQRLDSHFRAGIKGLIQTLKPKGPVISRHRSCSSQCPGLLPLRRSPCWPRAPRQQSARSAIGTDRLCRQVREHFRCWR
jgi:hypothetical protein